MLRRRRESPGKLLETPLGWAQAELQVERLRLEAHLTPLQERLCIVVKLQQASIEAAAVNVMAVGLLTEANQKPLIAALSRYMKLRFPGRGQKDSEESKRMRQAREMLAREVEKVYLISPYQGDGKDLVSGALESANPQLAAAARKAISIDAKNAKRGK